MHSPITVNSSDTEPIITDLVDSTSGLRVIENEECSMPVTFNYRVGGLHFVFDHMYFRLTNYLKHLSELEQVNLVLSYTALNLLHRQDFTMNLSYFNPDPSVHKKILDIIRSYNFRLLDERAYSSNVVFYFE